MNLNPLGLPADLRHLLVRLRRAATREGVDRAFADDSSAAAPAGVGGRVALASVRCGLLAADGRDREAVDLFERVIDPLLDRLSLPAQTELLENKADLLLSDWAVEDAADLARRVADRRALIQHPRRDYRAIVLGGEAALAGEHYEAVPHFWSELLQAQAGLSWRRLAYAHADYGREMLALGHTGAAAFHAVMSDDEHVVAAVAAVVAREPAAAGDLCGRVLPVSRLARHAGHAATLIVAAADLIPDDAVGAVVGWLVDRAARPIFSLPQVTCAESVWKAVAEFAFRLDPSAAGRLVAAGLDHPQFEGWRLRRCVLVAVNHLIARLSPADAAALVPQLLGPASEQGVEFGRAEALNALCHAVRRGGDEAATRQARERLFPPGVPVGDPCLAQVAPVFDVGPVDPGGVDDNARAAAGAVRKQVERLAAGVAPSHVVGSYGTTESTNRMTGGKLVVHIHGGMTWVNAALAHADRLGPAAADDLAAAMVASAGDDDNTVANRVALVGALRRLFRRMTPGGAAACVPVLLRHAAGRFAESAAAQAHAEATDPVNAFRMDFGDPADLRGSALVALAELARSCEAAAAALRDGAGGVTPGGPLAAALGDRSATVRAHACAAAREFDRLSAGELAAVLLSTSDPDADVAATAISAFGNPGRLGLGRPSVGLLLSALERAADRPEAAVRRSAARATVGLRGLELTRAAGRRGDALIARQLGDPAASVRTAASGGE